MINTNARTYELMGIGMLMDSSNDNIDEVGRNRLNYTIRKDKEIMKLRVMTGS